MTDQNQRSGDNSSNYQAARDIVLNGVSATEVRAIAMDLFKANAAELKEEAIKTAEERATRIAERIIQRFAEKGGNSFQVFKDPDFQYCLVNASVSYSRKGTQESQDILVDLVSERAVSESESTKSLILNSAIEVSAKLNLKHLKLLAFLFVTRHTMMGAQNLEALFKRFEDTIFATGSAAEKFEILFAHLESLGCLSISIGSNSMAGLLKGNYTAGFLKGFLDSELPNELKPKIEKYIINCFNDPAKKQLNFMNVGTLRTLLDKEGMSATEIDRAASFYSAGLMSDIEAIDVMERRIPGFKSVAEKWDKSNYSHASLTSIGRALAISYLHSLDRKDYDFDIWLQER